MRCSMLEVKHFENCFTNHPIQGRVTAVLSHFASVLDYMAVPKAECFEILVSVEVIHLHSACFPCNSISFESSLRDGHTI